MVGLTATMNLHASQLTLQFKGVTKVILDEMAIETNSNCSEKLDAYGELTRPYKRLDGTFKC